MKTLIIFLILVTVPFSYSCSHDEKSKECNHELNNEHQCKWSTLEYSFRSGTMPPPYFYSYSILINSDDASGFLKYAFDYSQEDNPPLEYKLTLSEEQMGILNEAIKESKVLCEEIESVPDSLQPIGGSVQNVKITIVNPDPNLDQPPRIIETPYFPIEEYKDGLENLYETINKLVPENIWEEIKTKKYEYIKQYEGN